MIFHCPFCGMKASPESAECSACHRRMLRGCPHCKETVAANAPLCKYCGEQIEAAPAPAPVREADIQFIDETPRRKGKGGLVAALLLIVLLGLGASFALRCAAGGSACRVRAKQMISIPEVQPPPSPPAPRQY